MDTDASSSTTATLDIPEPVAISAVGVRRSFGAVQAVADANLAVKPGKVTALIGPNGCGKTTLMLMLAGLLKPDVGDISVAGYSTATDSAAVRSRVGWMPDQLGSWDNLTCHQSLILVARAHKLSRNDARARGLELLTTVHLGEFADRPARVLSRGQKQRLSLARALVNDPSVLLLDEPANGLDPRSRVEMRQLVRDFAAQGKAVLISSHVLSELDEMVDEAVFMSKGRTLGEDTDAMVAKARTQYRVGALNVEKLHEVLTSWNYPYEPDANGAVIQVRDREHAAEVLSALVRSDVPVDAFGSAGSALEQTYMAMNEERR